MAGEWIKMRSDLSDDPAVFRIAGQLKLDKFSVIGRLHAFWAWADKHAVGGVVDGATTLFIDDIVRCDGFADALAAVGWLSVGEDSIEIPSHDRHNGNSAKERAMKNARQARWRQGKGADVDGEASTRPSTDASTREEKRREEKKEQKALVPSGDDTSAYSAEFESFWAEYPKREGGNSKKGAYKAWNARLRSGVKAEDMILSAKRYADQMQAKGNVGTSFVKQAATFLGPDEHWREALASNIHPLRTTASGGVVKGDSRTCPPLTRKGDFEYWNAIENRWEVRNSETHDPATGYAWSYLKSRGQA